VSWIVPWKPSGRPIIRRSQSIMRVSISVAAGEVCHSMHCAASVPMGHAGQHVAPEVGEDPLHRLARVGRVVGQPGRDLAGLDLGAHGIALDALQVVRHPVDQDVGMTAEILVVHLAAPHFPVVQTTGPREQHGPPLGEINRISHWGAAGGRDN
jgi:hypothetical protein